MKQDQKPDTIYVDLDDVISMTTDTFVSIVETEFGKNVGFDQIYSFNLKDSFQLNDEEYDHFFSLIHSPDLLMAFKPVKGSVQTLQDWADMGWKIDVVTGRPVEAYETSLEWLHLYSVPFEQFTMVDKYGRQEDLKGVAISKAELANRSYALAVEDSWEMACFLALEMDLTVALYNRPWNNNKITNKNIQRFFSWSDLYEFEEIRI